jgi:hypothetical protein
MEKAMKRTHREQLLKLYIKLERCSPKVDLKCETFDRIRAAFEAEDRDTLFSVIREHAAPNIETEDISWMVDQAINTLEDEVEYLRRFKVVQAKAALGE